MQIVYISNRPETLHETLDHVALFMPFVEEASVCVPDTMVDQFASQSGALPLQIIPESAILNDKQIAGLTSLTNNNATT